MDSRQRISDRRADERRDQALAWLRGRLTWTNAAAGTKPPVEVPREAGEAEWSVKRVEVNLYELWSDDAAKTQAQRK